MTRRPRVAAVHVTLDGRGFQQSGRSAETRRSFRGMRYTGFRRIWLAAEQSSRRDYDVWFYGGDVRAVSGARSRFCSAARRRPVPTESDSLLRPKNLRDAALHMLGRAPFGGRARRALDEARHPAVMTYNVHSCLGMDGKLSPARIARVIAQCNPDVVALQELDVRRARTPSTRPRRSRWS